jgi:hypothetical protein
MLRQTEGSRGGRGGGHVPPRSDLRLSDHPAGRGWKVPDILAELTEAAGGHAGAEGGFDAAFVAVGTHIGKRAYIPAGDSARIMNAVSLPRSMEDGSPPVVVYRRTRERIPKSKRRWGKASRCAGYPRSRTRTRATGPLAS